ncbi:MULTISPECIES: NADH-quinone oxidoreductase subunit K [Thermococcus]|uniref:Membrane-bound NADP+-reducing complex MBX, subunit MbxG (Na+/H+ transporter subunit) n=2 Tax=Thermococcus sibiricus TaxID=172049 RepID=C5ZZY0_THESM|nr:MULTISPECIES: NADH-quinone oxidoreductase subunit K [Thermococcus]KUK29180.1 MAG: Membrane-bound NADP+-reducing complex MBX, subunit MbxG (Na+/H+ transporter subunit) [Thermococcus sp. 40_45]HII66999.1 cation:proton antiporter [Thermococcaceae archaeon]ACS90961.1 Membrane-bound NADP+-reducing complex MBX, subunit MbxG (Na+/H+ transporter subunit) [Thermococcus sibiricus MM 739]KUK17198.1 MAG: Membrane-bound NADP+-reducing complex MBX, subunit MbxG (Na+/H+ transporter subunit) [Thermococcus s
MNPYYFASIALILIGLYAILVKRNVLKMLVGLSIMETGVNLLLISVGYVSGRSAPILSEGITPDKAVDPIPQALVLTAIVIGVATTAMALSVVINLYEKYKTLNVEEIRRLRG